MALASLDNQILVFYPAKIRENETQNKKFVNLLSTKKNHYLVTYLPVNEIPCIIQTNVPFIGENMPINYVNMQPQIAQMAKTASIRHHETLDRLEKCSHLLEQYAGNLPGLQRAAEERLQSEKNLRCAIPFSEPLTTHEPASLSLPSCTILAADGSQITPDPHSAVFYGLINVGVFRMSLGRGETPQANSWSDLIYEEGDPENNEFISEDLISLKRDVFEREIMATLAKQETAPVITLTDGPLELYHEPRNEEVFKRHFKKYISALQELALLETLTAGYIDRPRAALLVNLLELVSPPGPNGELPRHPFAGVSDLDLMEKLLQSGERSAVFALQSSSTNKYEGNLALHFFYLNVGRPNKPAIARVEIPLWVARSNEKITLIQSVLYEQASQAGAAPYPYALTRAHETAVVKIDEHDYLETLIQNELIAHGLPLSMISQKLMNKLVGKRTRY